MNTSAHGHVVHVQQRVLEKFIGDQLWRSSACPFGGEHDSDMLSGRHGFMVRCCMASRERKRRRQGTHRHRHRDCDGSVIVGNIGSPNAWIHGIGDSVTLASRYEGATKPTAARS